MPPGLVAGAHTETPGDRSGLIHAGESWAGSAYGVQERQHEGWEFYLQLEGRSEWLVADTRVAVAPGWLLAVAPGTLHASVDRRSFRHHFAYAAVDLSIVEGRHADLAQVWRGAGSLWAPDAWRCREPFRALVREVEDARAFTSAARAALVDRLVAEAARVLLVPPDPVDRRWRNTAVARARTLLDADYATEWRIEDLAAACGVSRAHLAERFTAEVGQPPYRYLLHRRVEAAMSLLADTTLPITDISVEAGFPSYGAMARGFRTLAGCSPSRWRQRFGRQ